MFKALSFADVLILPGFSNINSRKDVDLSADFMGEKLKLPIISAPMDTVTGPALGMELHKLGGLACLHRFQPIFENVGQFNVIFNETGRSPVVSVGLNDWDRVAALSKAGANKFILDVAHGGQEQVVNFVSKFYDSYTHHLMVGNFSSGAQVNDFLMHLNPLVRGNKSPRLSWRMGIGGGSACTTRIKTGCGAPTLWSVQSMKGTQNVIADGGIKTPGDIAKSLAVGAQVVMLGGMLGGTLEAPGELVGGFKKFRGSASSSSYKDQGKEWSTAEGEEFLIPYKGKLSEVIADIEGGLRSALTYVGASNLKEFADKAELIEITNSGIQESTAHGKL